MFALGLALLPAPAIGCAVLSPFEVADIAAGPIVVVGDVSGFHQGAFTLAVTEVLKGDAPARMPGTWPVTADGPPLIWDRPTRVVAAFGPATDGLFPLRGELCGRAHIAEATDTNLAAVRAALPK